MWFVLTQWPSKYWKRKVLSSINYVESTEDPLPKIISEVTKNMCVQFTRSRSENFSKLNFERIR